MLGKECISYPGPCSSLRAAKQVTGAFPRPTGRVVSARVLSTHGTTPSIVAGPDMGWRTDFSDAYLQGRLIGQGSFGVVYSGINMRNGEEVSVKVMPKTRPKLTKERTLQKILRETNLLNRLQPCERVVRLLDCFEDDAHVAIVMEYCAGGDLQRFVEVNGPLSEYHLALVAREVLTVVTSCHDLGVVHGDVKPSNFCLKHPQRNPLVSDDPALISTLWLKAVDFGCSQRLLIGGDRAKKRTGTPAFMAPEIFARNYGHKVDTWSTGVMLYWLYCMRFPFFTSNPLPVKASKLDEIREAVLNSPISFEGEPWTQMSDVGMDFMQCCLQRQESMRLSVSEALTHPWLSELPPAADATLKLPPQREVGSAPEAA